MDVAGRLSRAWGAAERLPDTASHYRSRRWVRPSNTWRG